MTSLNHILDSYPKDKPEDLIELPDDHPKPISSDTTIILNGHHNFNEEKESSLYVPPGTEEEAQPFLDNHKNVPQESKDMYPLKETFHGGSSPEDSEGEMGEELESSTHLLQDKEHNEVTTRTKPISKLGTYKSSPSRSKGDSSDPHPNVQHHPLVQDTLPDLFVHSKRHWPFTSLALVLVPCSLLLLSGCVGFALYFASSKTCDSARQWWQGAVVYEVFPASFQDSDGDGFGDIRGLVHRLDHVRKDLGVRVLRLNSIFSALDYPLEYEHAIDFANVDPHLGRMEDFQALVKEIHERGMFVLLDMNPTTTSDQHTWAAHWLLHRPGPFQNFYVNVTEEEDEEPPLEDNLIYNKDKKWPTPHRTFGNHLYLNWSNPLLQLEMQRILELWLSHGVDGFYMKHLDTLHVTDTDHLSTILLQWRSVLDRFSANSTKRVLMVSHQDIGTLETLMDPLTFTSIPPLVDMVDARVDLGPNGTVCGDVEGVVKFWTQFEYPPQLVWHTGSVENLRMKRKGDGEYHLASAFLRMVLPGSFSTFYGDEIGLGNSFDPVTDEIYRGGQLTPMQWTSGPKANFTDPDTTPWLPVHPDHTTRNIANSTEQLALFAKLVRLKEEESFPLSMSRTPSLLHTLAVRFENDPTSDYQWYYDSCLLVVRVVATDVVLVANFGAEAVAVGDATDCPDRHPRCQDPAGFMHRVDQPFEVVLTTNSSVDGRIQLKKLQLQPGLAIIGRFIT